ncbi:polyketide synthase family protein [Mycobacterium sp. JS623]|uniref:type I polyketide synthase n=1 Tax=Mycobacterium sp. JS623 TaxID=212767 RepID=UPI0002A5A105|nr:type I polyketide synthase [Mycobacterium sp. JS623]AGB26047.1 polyketide synthase family protein [Mycobacterium sp. JS623]
MTTAASDRRTIISEALRKIDELTARLEIAEKSDVEPIAVVGLGCRFPGGVNNPGEYWTLLREGRSGIVRVPPDRWDADAFYSDDHTVPGTICTREGGFLTSWKPDEFDAEFFSIAPREAAAMDPQQRLVLEVAWEALEDAGITAQAIRGSQASVFIGLTTNDYAMAFAGKVRHIDAYASFGNASNFAAGRLAYFLGVRGPALVIDTACSSSLVAVHLACQSLRRWESDTALAAGVNLILRPENSIACSRFGMLSPDGRCKTFDAGADGYVRSEGCGVVVLKRISDAVRDGDRMLAVVRGSAVNQDGASSGQTVPNGPAQQALLRQALAASRLQPSDIDYVEAHGTGTALGDPIELDALSHVFCERDGAAPLVVGSVKTNLGHLESAAGIAGFIKTVLAVRNGYIPRHLNFERLTPHASEGVSEFMIASQPMQWPPVRRQRRAGVSSFGVSGTNSHVVVEQAPEPDPVLPQANPVVTTLVISGKTPARIASTAQRLADWLEADGHGVALPDVAHTVNHHRSRYPKFATVSARDRAQALAGLRALAEGRSAAGVSGAHVGPCGAGTVFIYSGQGSQWAGMGRRLLGDEPAFASAVADLEPVFIAQCGFSLQQTLDNGDPIVGIDRIQPVLVGMHLALTALWRAYGVHPDAVVGHSMGEVSAAVVAGALSPGEGLRVIATRSRLMARLAGQGAMALLELGAVDTEALIGGYPGVGLAVYASPRQTVVAGPPDQVDAVIALVAAKDRLARRIEVDVASHHPTVDPILPELRCALADLMPRTPSLPVITTTADHMATGTTMFDAEYWAANLRQPVRFTQAVAAAAEKHSMFVEVSPHPLLTHAVSDTLGRAHHHSIGTLQRDTDDTLTFHTNRNATHTIHPPQTPHPCEPHPPIPTTPWHHTQHWIRFDKQVEAAGGTPKPGTLLGEHIAVTTTPPADVWQARLAPEARPYPGDHRISGVELVPASVVLLTLSTAASECGAPMLSDVRFEHPIVVDQPKVIQVVATDRSIIVSSSPAADAPADRWVRHATARMSQRREADNRERTDTVWTDQPLDFDVSSIADLQRSWGLEGQPFAWSIASLQSMSGGLCAEVDLPQASTVALLDAAVHVARLADGTNPRLMFPASVESARLAAGVAAGRGRVEIRRRRGPGDELVVDISVTAPDGITSVDIRGLRYVSVDSGPGADSEPASIAHVIEWRPWAGHAAGTPVDASGTLAVVGGSEAVQSLREKLADAGYPVADAAEARYVVYLAEPEAVSGGDTDLDCAVRSSAEVADLVHRLAERDDNHPATLWIITRGVREGLGDNGLCQSCLWGLAGVIEAEQPQLWGGLLDLPAGEDIADHAVRLSSVLATPARSILALRGGEFLAPALAAVSGERVREPLTCRPDAAYLITGGLGALGLLTATWLADRGARRLVLAGRTALPPRRDWDNDANGTNLRRAIATIRALESRGVTVEAVALDAGSADAVQHLLARRDGDGAAPIRGVVHAAGVTDSQLLTELDDTRLRRTMWPKIAGAQALHQAFPPATVDFLYLIASAGAIFGVPGQGAYAAANAYLDGLARARRQKGCHTVSLDWAAWRGIGFATDAPVVAQELERMGSRPITPEEAFAAWKHVDCYDVAQAVMIPMRSAPTGDQPPKRAWTQMAAEDMLGELETELRTIVSRELGMRNDELELDRPFADMGLNSVMAMSVRREAELLVDTELSATMMWNHPTIASLAAYLANKLASHGTDSDMDGVSAETDGLLDALFDTVEASACNEGGL